MKTKVSKRVRNQQERSRNLVYLDDFCTDHGIEKKLMSPYQLRMTKGKTVIDAYPTSKKLCIIRLNGTSYSKWTTFNEVEDILEYFD